MPDLVSEPVSCSLLAARGEGDGEEEGLGVTVERFTSVRGIELISRSNASGRVLSIRGCFGVGNGVCCASEVGSFAVEGGAADWAFSIQAALAAGSIGQEGSSVLFAI